MPEPISNQQTQQSLPKRNTAIKASIKEIIEGKYIREEGWTPNYIITKTNKEIIRANIIAAIVDKNTEELPHTLTIDDGTASIQLRIFENSPSMSEFNTGDMIQVIGKPREYGSERYFLPEIIKKINPLWGAVRKLELEKETLKATQEKKASSAISSLSEEKDRDIDTELVDFTEEIIVSEPTQEILDYIKKNDTGTGVDIEEILLKTKIENAERILQTLLEQGEIFEVRPGRVKTL